MRKARHLNRNGPDPLVALEDLLRVPTTNAPFRSAFEEKWAILKSELYASLVEVLTHCFHTSDSGARRALEGVGAGIKNWAGVADEKDERTQWLFARALLGVAYVVSDHCVAKEIVPILRNYSEAALAALGPAPPDADWVQVAFYSLLEAVGKAVHDNVPKPDVRVIPVALVSPDGGGFVAYVSLERLSGGSGRLAHHPRDLFQTEVDEFFKSSMRRAWAWAGGGPEDPAQTDRHGFKYDGRWRLLRRSAGGRPLPDHPDVEPAVVGPSASGAIARGWRHVLADTFPDDEVIVIAEVAHTPAGAYTLSHVSDDLLPVKIAAILKDAPEIDTIVVTERNREAAEEALGNMERTYRLTDSDGRQYRPGHAPGGLCCVRL